MSNRKPITILMAEDDPEDQMLVQEAFREAHLANDLRFVQDGEDLLDYLYQRGKYSNASNASRPGLILLDLSMPRKDGREALRDIKSDPSLRRIPVVVLTTSQAEEDILRSYDEGVSGFITKPLSFDAMVEVVRALGKYWFEIVELPDNELRCTDGLEAEVGRD